jgi:metal-dependent hydrolase (beta-lactamase superfamily II)
VRLLAPVHCTGKRGTAHLRERLADAFVACTTGTVLELD